MSVAYERALVAVPKLIREGDINAIIDTLGRALASEWREDLIASIPSGSEEFDRAAFVVDYLTSGGNDHKVAIGSLLGWAAGVGCGDDPIRFTEIYSATVEAIFIRQLEAEIENVQEHRRNGTEFSESPIQTFFGSDEMNDFLEEHATGKTPWNVAMDGNGRLVITDYDRSMFFAVAPREDMFVLYRYDDAMDLIDTQSEKGELLAHQYTPAAAFRCFLNAAELSPNSPSI